MEKIIKTEKILHYMKANGLTKTAFCQECKIGFSVLNKILNNEINFKIKSLFKIARKLNIHIHELFE